MPPSPNAAGRPKVVGDDWKAGQGRRRGRRGGSNQPGREAGREAAEVGMGGLGGLGGGVMPQANPHLLLINPPF